MSKKLFLLFVFFSIYLPVSSSFAAFSLEVPLPASPTLYQYIVYFFDAAMILSGILALIVLTISGVQLIASSGNPEKTSEAKKRAISAVVGLIILLVSFTIIQTINPKLKNLTPTEDLRMAGAFRFVGGRDGEIGTKSGCGIDECLGLDGTCSWDNCGGFDYTGCKGYQCLAPGETLTTDPNGNSCSPDNCKSSISGCKLNECLGLDGSCSWQNCNWAIEKPSPISMENTDEILQRYSMIVWKSSYADLTGNRVNGCDPNNQNVIYNLYLYNDYNFKKLKNIARLRCNDWRISLEKAKSFILVKETPGVYFYGNENCYPSGDTPPATFTESAPEGWNEEVKSIRIVNGPDSAKGPFFGLIYFSAPDYTTNAVDPWTMEIQPKIWKWPDFEAYDNYSYCFPVGSIKNGSWVVYQWIGFEEDGKTVAVAGDGVTLFSKTDWLGGYNQSSKRFSRISVNLNTTPVIYSTGSGVPLEEQKLCPYFYTDSFCLKSFEIKGDYLVIASSNLFRGNNRPHQPDFYNVHAQAFPISPRLKVEYKDRQDYSVAKGTPELQLDYIGWLKQIKFIEIIPLAGKSN